MRLIHTKCYKLAENPLIMMLFSFNISVPSPLLKKSYTSHVYLFIICILLFVTSWSICSCNPPFIVYILNVCWVLTEGLIEDWLLHQTSHPLKIKNLLTYLLTYLLFGRAGLFKYSLGIHLIFCRSLRINEPQHDKTNNMIWEPSKNSNQPGHLLSLRCL